MKTSEQKRRLKKLIANENRPGLSILHRSCPSVTTVTAPVASSSSSLVGSTSSTELIEYFEKENKSIKLKHTLDYSTFFLLLNYLLTRNDTIVHESKYTKAYKMETFYQESKFRKITIGRHRIGKLSK